MARSLRLLSTLFISGFLISVIYLFSLFNYQLPHLSSFNDTGWVERFLSEKLQQNVRIGQMFVRWQGTQPAFYINDLEIINDQGKTNLEVKNLKVGINLIGTILAHKIIPGDLTISGLHLVLREMPNGKLDINNIPALQADLHTQNSKKISYLLDCYLSSGMKVFQRVSVSWYDQTGRLVLPIHDLNFTGRSYFLSHSLLGHLELGDGSKVSLDAKLYGHYLAQKLLFAHSHLWGDLQLADSSFLNTFTKDFQIQKGKVKFDGVMTMKPLHATRMSSILNGDDVAIQMPRPRKDFVIDHFSTVLSFTPAHNGWSLLFDRLKLNIANNLIPIDHLILQKRSIAKKTNYNIKVGVFSIKEIVGFLTNHQFLPDNVISLLLHVKPTGHIYGFNLDYGKDTKQLAIQGWLDRVSVMQWQKYPGLRGLSGRLSYLGTEGRFELNSSDAVLSYKPLFRFDIPINKIAGHIQWQQDSLKKWLIKGKDIFIETPEGKAKGFIDLVIPNNLGTPTIKSKFRFAVSNTDHAAKYYPVTIMPSSVVSWLDEAIKGGEITNGVFILDGKMNQFPFDAATGKFLISGELKNGKLHYLDGWPTIEGIKAHLLFSGRSMRINAEHATAVGARIYNVEAKINNLERATLLIKGRVTTASNQAVVLNKANNPLANFIHSNYLNDLLFKGKSELDLNLSLPLDKDLQSNNIYRGLLKLDNVDVLNHQLNIRKLKGSLAFSNDSADAQLITGKLFDKDFQLSMLTKAEPRSKNTRIIFNADLAIEDLRKFLNAKFLDLLHGVTHIKGEMTITKPLGGAAKIVTLLQTNFLGIESNLPSPFNKLKTAIVPSQFRVIENDKILQFIFNYGEIINGIVNTKLQNNRLQVDRAHIVFGKSKAVSPPSKGVKIEGTLPQLDWPSWKMLLPTSSTKNKDLYLKPPSLPIQFVNLRIDQFKVSPDFNLSNMILIGYSRNDGFALAIDSSALQAEVLLPQAFPNQPLKINVHSFSLQNYHKIESTLTPREIPPIDLTIGSFRYKDKLFNNLAIKLRPQGNNLVIKEASINDAAIKMNVNGIWHATTRNQETSLSGSIESANLGAMLSQWHITDTIVKGKGRARFNFSWANSIFNFDANSLQGNVDLDFTKGRIIKLSRQANFGMDMGRVLTLFSLQTLPRRLMLDFSDLTEPGFSFDKMKGLLQFQKGNIFTDNTTIDGPLANIRIAGRIGFTAKDYNLRITVNPYVTSSLPVVATLTGGPIIGAATWLVDKIFSRQVKQITEIHYHVTGSWDKPNLKNLTE